MLWWTRQEDASPAKLGLDWVMRKLSGIFKWRTRKKETLAESLLSNFSERDSWMLLFVMVFCGLLSLLLLLRRRRKSDEGIVGSGKQSNLSSGNGYAFSTDPSLLKKHSVLVSYSITSQGKQITYPSIRTFFHPHPQAPKLPTSPTPLPLLVFIHGLGGSVAQFHPLLTSLVNIAPCLAIDLPGCGLSAFGPHDWNAYTIENLAQLVATAIDQYRDKDLGQEVVLVGHSLGCSIAALLASSTSGLAGAQMLSKHILGLIAICPRADPPTAKEVALFKSLLSIPESIFDFWRRWDKRGGTKSASVLRFVGVGAEDEVKRLQVRFNEQSRTPVWRRMARGTLPNYSRETQGGLPGKAIWSKVPVPIMLIAGQADKITPPDNLQKIAKFLGKTSHEVPGQEMETGKVIVDDATPVDSDLADGNSTAAADEDALRTDSGAFLRSPSTNPPHSLGSGRSEQATHAAPLKTTILPAPAAHALLYAPSTVRTVAGLLQAFLSSHIDPRLSLGWQLQYLTTEGKWDVKNLAKWRGVRAVSGPIPSPIAPDSSKKSTQPNVSDTQLPKPSSSTAQGTRQQRIPVFRAMKTLREADDVHSPPIFVKHWQGKIKAVIDISHESPVYDSNGLDEGGIEYHKFPTVSKLPPTVEEVDSFIGLVDRLRKELSVGGPVVNENQEITLPPLSEVEAQGAPVIGVHCHYGYNRTGFFVVSYLVERLGFDLQEALDEFEKQRPPGIRHGHFIDQLFVRYCVGLTRAPTL